MKKLLVEDVKVGVSRGGMACGPVSGSVVAEVCIRDLEKETVKYYSLTEVEGIPNLCETDESTYDRQIEEVDDKEFWEMLIARVSSDFSDYDDFFSIQGEMKLRDPEFVLICKYLIYMVRADWEEVEQLKASSVGKCLGDFDIPISDLEQEYLDDICEEESEETEETEEPDGSDSRESLLEMINADFKYEKIDVSTFIDRDENEMPGGHYSSQDNFEAGGNHYRIEYSLWVNDDAEITSVDWPKCLKLVDGEYVPCPDGEVSNRKIYEMLHDELNNWL